MFMKVQIKLVLDIVWGVNQILSSTAPEEHKSSSAIESRKSSVLVGVISDSDRLKPQTQASFHEASGT